MNRQSPWPRPRTLLLLSFVALGACGRMPREHKAAKAPAPRGDAPAAGDGPATAGADGGAGTAAGSGGTAAGGATGNGAANDAGTCAGAAAGVGTCTGAAAGNGTCASVAAGTGTCTGAAAGNDTCAGAATGAGPCTGATTGNGAANGPSNDTAGGATACAAAELARAADNVAAVKLKPTAANNPSGDPQLAVNGIDGAGDGSGGTDVFSLDNATDGSLTVSWTGAALCDGPGDDLVIFENAFRFGTKTFIEPVIVGVSWDGEHFVDFPHDYSAPDETTAPGLGDPAAWRGFAGLTPVRFRDNAGLNPFDPAAAGGDAFDLAHLPAGDTSAQVKAQGVRFVRLTAAPAALNPDTGVNFPNTPYAGRGFADIDGVYGRYVSRKLTEGQP